MANQEDSFTVSVVSNGIGTAAGTIQGLIAEAYHKTLSDKPCCRRMGLYLR